MVASYPSGVQGRAPVGMTAWDRLAPAYGLAVPDHFSQFGERLLSRVRVDPSAAVLDLACGPGTMASVMARIAPSVDVVAVDLSVGMLHRAAREVTAHRAGRCAVAAMDAHLLGFVDRAFGLVLCGSALDSFPDPGRALAEAHRVLRPGGTLGLWVAPRWWWQGDSRWAWHDDLLAGLGVDAGEVPSGLAAPAALRHMLQAAGFQDVQVRADELGLWFPDAEAWWRWAWSHGFRQVLERLSAGQLGAYREACRTRIGHGGIEARMEALIATAARHYGA